ncbi:MAG: gliding motility-associated C-terminal domain-containing protein [Cyclobacteriaceae bacterium]
MAQPSKRANIWYFGQNAGLDFNNLDAEGHPSVLTDGQIKTDEGSAVISDEAGNLLFYTDGETVWNRAHEIMPNGEGLKGSFSSTQSALIVPQPGSDRLYYVFTTAAQGGIDGLNYSVVDMTESGALGDVIIKNALLYTPTTEKLTAVLHTNGRDVWVITHKWESDEFYTYLVSEEGLDETPVISATGSIHEFGGSNGNTIGQMKVSSNGNILALNISTELRTEIFNFNCNSGTLQFIKALTTVPTYDPSEVFMIYGMEISLNESYLYISESAPELYNGQKIYQVDINNEFSSVVEEVFIGGNLQKATDGRIYTVDVDQQELVAIDRPNLPADHPDFTISRISITPGFCLLGLPNFIQSYLKVADPLVEMPNVFSPNEDGVNDTFLPKAFHRIETFQLKIIDRSGALVYQTSSPEQWWDGGASATGTYYWYLQYEGVNGKSGKLKGWVQLMR